MLAHCYSCTRDDRKERIVAAGNSVRQALQELLSEYMENAGTKPTEQLDDAIQVIRGKSLLKLWVTTFLSRLTVTLNLCQIYLKLPVHVL